MNGIDSNGNLYVLKSIMESFKWFGAELVKLFKFIHEHETLNDNKTTFQLNIKMQFDTTESSFQGLSNKLLMANIGL